MKHQITEDDIDHIFQSLRTGIVPDRGLFMIAVGIEQQLNEIERHINFVKKGEGTFKFLRGGYGCGKTFLSKLSMQMALEQNLAVSMIVVSPNDTKFHEFDEVYSKIIGGLKTNESSGGTLAYCMDQWIGKIEQQLEDEGNDYEEDPEFDSLVERRFEIELSEIIKEEAGLEFISILRSYFKAKQEGDIQQANYILSWLSGSKNISSNIKKKAGIKGEISNKTALTYLKGILAIIRKAGYSGLLVVVDEMETILRMRRDVREKSLNGIRQIIDASVDNKGLMWIFTGTPEFFDTQKGVKGLQALFDRIKFIKMGEYASIKQAQLELLPFTTERLVKVAKLLRELYYQKKNSSSIVMQKVSDLFIERLSQKVNEGLKTNIGTVPRAFLREFVGILDLIEEYPDFEPMATYQFDSTKYKETSQEHTMEEVMDDTIPYQEF